MNDFFSFFIFFIFLIKHIYLVLFLVIMKSIKLSIKLKQERGSLKKNKLCDEFIHKLLKISQEFL